ncbi:hypothetical protein PF003_g12040 [Phytophthora fragariae]|nr:hypothetical protein PF003_g12040 [Phytophthora fragariae]
MSRGAYLAISLESARVLLGTTVAPLATPAPIIWGKPAPGCWPFLIDERQTGRSSDELDARLLQTGARRPLAVASRLDRSKFTATMNSSLAAAAPFKLGERAFMSPGGVVREIDCYHAKGSRGDR